MSEVRKADATSKAAAPARIRPSPSGSSEYITLLAHYHRAEIARMAGWRDRMDRTTHWALTAVGAMLSVTLSAATAHHGIILVAMVLVTLLLVIEARRYRFFDVYRARVRLVERNWFAPIFASEDPPDDAWLRELAEDLRQPAFLMSFRQAISRRVRRTYGWMFLILLFAWLIKTVASNPSRAGYSRPVVNLAEWFANARWGPVPGEAVVACVAAFYGWLAYLALRRYELRGELAHGEVHV